MSYGMGEACDNYFSNGNENIECLSISIDEHLKTGTSIKEGKVEVLLDGDFIGWIKADILTDIESVKKEAKRVVNEFFNNDCE